MNNIEKLTGQTVDFRSGNDNAPAKYSAPSHSFKQLLTKHANPYCSRCRGSGYIGTFKHISAGRCFKCIPEAVWGVHEKSLISLADQSRAQ